MSNQLDDNIIQRFLYINADQLQQKIASVLALNPTVASNTKILSQALLTDTLSNKQAADMIARQHELVSANMAPTSGSALELFADPKKDNYFINGGYTISHNIIYTANNTKYTFNIDELNRLANSNPDGFGGKFIVHKLNIVNKSKDAFTAKANFQVTFHIAFNFFDDLKEELIIAKNISNPDAPVLKLSLMNLLYPYYSKNLPKNISNETKERKTGNGIVLNQVLSMDPGNTKFFSNTKSALANNTEIHKNYHLTFYKHSINLFKSGESTLKPFDSELVIDFIAYEADETVNSNKDPKTPSLSNNLYTLLQKQRAAFGFGSTITGLAYKADSSGKQTNYGKDLYSLFFSVLKDWNLQIQNLELSIRCQEQGINIANLNTGINAGDTDFKKKTNEQITALKENIDKLIREFSESLFKTLINKLEVYSFDIQADTVIAFKDANRLGAALKAMDGVFTTIGGLGVAAASLGVATGGVATLGAGLGIAAVGGYAFATAEGDVLNKGVALLRSGLQNITISKTSANSDNFFEFIKNVNFGTAINNPDKIVDEALKIGVEARKIEKAGQQIKVQFILFGQLVDIINSISTESEVVIGGKTVPVDSNFNAKYLNYYYLPIDYFKLLQFLNEKIAKRTNYVYNTEVFLREIVETFLKEAVLQDGVLSDALKEMIPTHVTMNVHTVDGDSNNSKEFLKNVTGSILNDDLFTKLKQNFILGKNLNASKGNKKLKKIYTITGDEQISYYNFYAEYNDWRFRYKTGQPNTSELFQEFIVSRYHMPCLRTKAVDRYGSILINKNLHFSRKDNANLVTGQLLDNSALFRLPYVVTGQFKPYIFFFMDVSSFIFVAPPDKRDGKLDTVDTFGYSGLYLIKNSSFEYTFQLLDNNNAPIFPNEKSKCELVGQLVTYGDGRVPQQTENRIKEKDIKSLCEDPQPVSTEPAEQ